MALGGKQEVEDLSDDPPVVPIVTASEVRNGVATWKGAEILYHPPVITVSTDGIAGAGFVQEFPFYAFYKVALLRPKDYTVPTDALYYVAYMLTRERWRYIYARKFGKGRLEDTILWLPTRDLSPDFEVMAKIVRQCAGYEIIKSFRGVLSVSVCELSLSSG